MADLKEIRALAAAVYPSLAAHGYSTEKAIEGALSIAEQLVARSEARADAALSITAEVVGGPSSGGRPLVPQRNALAGP